MPERAEQLAHRLRRLTGEPTSASSSRLLGLIGVDVLAGDALRDAHLLGEVGIVGSSFPSGQHTGSTMAPK